MVDQINKILYLAFGIILLLVALTSFYNNNQSFIQYKDLYEETKSNNSPWINDSHDYNKNPLGIVVSDPSLIRKGLVFNGEETKSQLLALIKSTREISIYKEGIKVLESDYMTVYHSIEASEQVLLTYDYELNIVYIETL